MNLPIPSTHKGDICHAGNTAACRRAVKLEPSRQWQCNDITVEVQAPDVEDMAAGSTLSTVVDDEDRGECPRSTLLS